MMFISQYGLPLASALLLLMFFFCLPELSRCRLPEFGLKKPEGFSLKSSAAILLITIAYSFVAFFNLGNTVSPESFQDMSGKTAVIEFKQPESISKVMIFPGVGMGEYEISYHAVDGSRHVRSFQQGHIQVLCWSELSTDFEGEITSVEIACVGGSPWLGEIAFYSEDGSIISALSSLSTLCDEQEKVPQKSHFMNSTYFDEIYHARTAWEHLHDIWPYEISHPPLAKIIMGIGIELFGMSPFGWRFTGTLCGVLMLPLMFAFLKKMFGGVWIPALGSLILASDFMHFSQTRIATIDSYAVFFILLMYYFMYRYLTENSKSCLALCGISFGVGVACKWTCIYAGAGLAVLWLLHWVFSFVKAEKSSRKLLKPQLLQNILFCLVFFVVIPGFIYYLSYIPYGRAEGCLPFSSEYTKIFLDNQQFMFSYHAGVNAEHPYSSRWYQWLLNIRPILYYLEYFDNGSRSSIASFLNPALCWGGFIFLFVLGYTAIGRKDKVAAFILIGYLSQVLPWVFISRITFEYHYFAASVFLVIAIAYVFQILRLNVKNWLPLCIGFSSVSVLLFVLFYPAISGKPIDNQLGSALLGWLPSWPL